MRVGSTRWMRRSPGATNCWTTRSDPSSGGSACSRAAGRSMLRNVSARSGSDPSTVMPTLGVARRPVASLIRADGPDGSRFRMLAPLAEYAMRLLAESEELGAVSLAHAQYYLALASQGSPQWQRNDPAQLDLMRWSMRTAWRRCASQKGREFVPIVLGFDIALLGFWGIRGHMRTGQRRLEAASRWSVTSRHVAGRSCWVPCLIRTAHRRPGARCRTGRRSGGDVRGWMT